MRKRNTFTFYTYTHKSAFCGAAIKYGAGLGKWSSTYVLKNILSDSKILLNKVKIHLSTSMQKTDKLAQMEIIVQKSCMSFI